MDLKDVEVVEYLEVEVELVLDCLLLLLMAVVGFPPASSFLLGLLLREVVLLLLLLLILLLLLALVRLDIHLDHDFDCCRLLLD